MIKKYLTILALTAVATTASLAQGTLVFANNSSTLVNVNNGTSTAAMAVGGGFVEFLYAPVGTLGPTGASDINPSGWTALGGAFGISPVAGRFNGGTLTVPGLTPAGGSIAGLVRSWTGAYASYSLAIGGGAFVGYSSTFLVDTGDPTSVPPGTATGITTGASPFTSFTVSAVPEPSSMVLAGLGAASLLMFRRRS